MIKSIKFNNKADLPLIRPNFIKGCNSLLIGEFLTKDLDMCDYFDFDKYNVKIYNLSTLEEINNIVPQVTPNFHLNALNLSLVGSKKGIFYLGENILVKPSGFFNDL